MKKEIRIGTNKDPISLDQVMAIVIVCSFLEENMVEIDTVEALDPKTVSECDVVIGVGGVYDPSRGRFDIPFSNEKESVQFSFSSLVWKQYGYGICMSYFCCENEDLLTKELFRLMDEKFNRNVHPLSKKDEQVKSSDVIKHVDKIPENGLVTFEDTMGILKRFFDAELEKYKEIAEKNIPHSKIIGVKQ